MLEIAEKVNKFENYDKKRKRKQKFNSRKETEKHLTERS